MPSRYTDEFRIKVVKQIPEKIYYLVILTLISVLFYGCESESVINKEPGSHDSRSFAKAEHGQDTYTELQHQYDEMESVAYLEKYIENVINEGSDVLGLPAGSMAAGYSDPSDAPKIAAYVVSIAGKSPSSPEYIQDGGLYYAGNCSGCHGSDGKGMGGAYPDLTLPLLDGLQLKKRVLKRRIEAISLKTRKD